jgi:hypothetical protein
LRNHRAAASALLGQCIEGNRGAWGSLMNSIDDGFEYCDALESHLQLSSIVLASRSSHFESRQLA